ncbi:MAG: cytosine deaminase [Pseudanabaena sp. ELA607]
MATDIATVMHGRTFWLVNAHLPLALLDQTLGNFPLIEFANNQDGLCLASLEIQNGILTQILPQSALINHHESSSGTIINQQLGTTPVLDLRRRIILPCLIDAHTHLDKGHIWEYAPNLTGTFADAITAVVKARQHSQLWHYENLYRRMEFGLQCSYAHGTQLIRTHLDCPETGLEVVLQVFQDLRQAWQNRLLLQPVSLTSLDSFTGEQGERIADQFADLGGVLGGVAYMNPQLASQLQRFFELAAARGMDVDLHVDENDDPNSQVLDHVARIVLELRGSGKFTGKVTCGHCCSLAVQDELTAFQTINLVKEAQISIISLPLCNLYLQDRYVQDRETEKQLPKTPFWRGVTRIHELHQAGVPIALASDNCRDPFYGFGDHDLLQVLAWGTQIAHLDRPYGQWISSITQTPAALLNMPHLGRFHQGMAADLILFRGRTYSELFSRSESERQILRQGKLITAKLPDYENLDDLI